MCGRGTLPNRPYFLHCDSEPHVVVLRTDVFNVDEVEFAFERANCLQRCRELADVAGRGDGAGQGEFAIVSAQFEAELSLKSGAEQCEYLSSLGVSSDDLVGPTSKGIGGDLDSILSYGALPQAILSLLNLSLAYTGPGVPRERSQTTRAHLFRRHALSAEGLAGRIHGDILKGFIKAEISPANELLGFESFTDAKDAGAIRMEGREYLLKDADVVLVRWNIS